MIKINKKNMQICIDKCMYIFVGPYILYIYIYTYTQIYMYIIIYIYIVINSRKIYNYIKVERF